MMKRFSFGTAAASAGILLASAISLCGVATVAQAQTETKTKAAETRATTRAAEPRAADARTADREAIAALLQSFEKAFVARDAQALAGHWTEEGEYENNGELSVSGHEVLAKAFGDFFAKTPELSAEMRSESLRFLGRDTAVGEGRVAVRKGPAAAVTKANYTALLVREEGKWRIAKLSETTNDELAITDLTWLIGEWKSLSGSGAEVHTTYAWSSTKKFIHVDFTVKEKGLTLSGKQVIGVDPATGQFRSWTFGADGGVGEATWSRDGDHWALAAEGTLADGRALSETNLLRRINHDTFTWQSINRTLDGAEFPDLPPVKVTRVKSEN